MLYFCQYLTYRFWYYLEFRGTHESGSWDLEFKSCSFCVYPVRYLLL